MAVRIIESNKYYVHYLVPGNGEYVKEYSTDCKNLIDAKKDIVKKVNKDEDLNLKWTDIGIEGWDYIGNHE